MRRSLPTARRLITLGGAVFVGLATTALFAAPASAHVADLSLDTKCVDGQVKVAIQVTNDYGAVATLTNVNAKPSLKKIAENATVAAKVGDTDGVLKESITVAPGTEVSLGFTATWNDKQKPFVLVVKPKSADTKLDCGTPCPPSISADGKGKPGNSDCPPPCPSASSQDLKKGGHGGDKPPVCESASPSPSTGGEGGGKPAPSTSSSSPTLPVTGSQTSLIAGGAVVLLGAGTGLFFLARRRRVKFEA